MCPLVFKMMHCNKVTKQKPPVRHYFDNTAFFFLIFFINTQAWILLWNLTCKMTEKYKSIWTDAVLSKQWQLTYSFQNKDEIIEL